MIVRQFKPVDAEAASEVIIKCLTEINSKFYSDDVIQEMINIYSPSNVIQMAKDQLFLVAEEFDESIIGTATITKNIFGSVFVHPEYQHQGVGTKLMRALENLARTKGREEVILHASINAVKFYERHGYKKIRHVKDAKFGNSYEMKKKL